MTEDVIAIKKSVTPSHMSQTGGYVNVHHLINAWRQKHAESQNQASEYGWAELLTCKTAAAEAMLANVVFSLLEKFGTHRHSFQPIFHIVKHVLGGILGLQIAPTVQNKNLCIFKTTDTRWAVALSQIAPELDEDAALEFHGGFCIPELRLALVQSLFAVLCFIDPVELCCGDNPPPQSVVQQSRSDQLSLVWALLVWMQSEFEEHGHGEEGQILTAHISDSLRVLTRADALTWRLACPPVFDVCTPTFRVRGIAVPDNWKLADHPFFAPPARVFASVAEHAMTLYPLSMMLLQNGKPVDIRPAKKKKT